MSRRKNKKLSEEEVNEVSNFVNRKNPEDDNLFGHIKIEIKPKTENQKKLV